MPSHSSRIRNRSSAIEVDWGVATHVGNVRSLNEDVTCASPPVFAVADGMGGHDGGEIAASLAAGALSAFTSGRSLQRSSLLSSISAAGTLIFEHSGRGEKVMGTTLTGIAFTDERQPSVAVFNVGDSRTYLLENGVLTQVTRDHSYVQELFDAGKLTIDEMSSHPERNVVTRALGVDQDVEVDETTVLASVGQRWMMCSDGLTGEVTPSELEDLLANGSPQEAADALVRLTLERTASDNVSVVIVDVVGLEQLDDPDRTDPRVRRVEAESAPEKAGSSGIIDAVPAVTRQAPPTAAPQIELIDSVPDGLRQEVKREG